MLGARRDERQALAVALNEEEANSGNNDKGNQGAYDGAGFVGAAAGFGVEP